MARELDFETMMADVERRAAEEIEGLIDTDPTAAIRIVGRLKTEALEELPSRDALLLLASIDDVMRQVVFVDIRGSWSVGGIADVVIDRCYDLRLAGLEKRTAARILGTGLLRASGDVLSVAETAARHADGKWILAREVTEARAAHTKLSKGTGTVDDLVKVFFSAHLLSSFECRPHLRELHQSHGITVNQVQSVTAAFAPYHRIYRDNRIEPPETLSIVQGVARDADKKPGGVPKP